MHREEKDEAVFGVGDAVSAGDEGFAEKCCARRE